MIDLEMLDFLYDYQNLSIEHQRIQIASFRTQTTEIIDAVRSAQAELLYVPQEFIAKIHQLKSSALVLCSNELNRFFTELNTWPLAKWDATEVSNRVDELLVALLAYYQQLEFLESFLG